MLHFSTKAGNLAQLYSLQTQNKLKHTRVLPLLTTTLNTLQNPESKNALLDSITTTFATFQCQKLIIRSSSQAEDSTKSSNAGAYESIANVDSNDKKAVLEAINQVALSMPNPNDEVLIQPMLESISMCGVAFSVDKESGAPYFCISYDRSGSNSAITSGSDGEIISFCEFRGYKDLEANASKVDSKNLDIATHHSPDYPYLERVMDMMRELEDLFDCKALDVEFALSADVLYCLQVRVLVIAHTLQNNLLTTRALSRLYKRIDSLCAPQEHILGKRSVFGVMPDWNPAEIIGLKPKRLALSLYKEIVTDNIWAYQRDNYGYRNLRSHPLMHSFLGIPYIDVRLSFNSFIPKNLDSHIASKLVDYYTSELVENPQLHDKIEFDIVLSCYDLALDSKLKKLLNFGFNANELKRIEFSLLELTNSILNPQNGLYLKDLRKMDELRLRYEGIVRSSAGVYDKIYWCIEDCKRFGTLPFAGIARAAFVAMQMLHSLVEIGFLSLEEKESFLASLHSVSKDLSMDLMLLKTNGNKKAFLEKYGHLRAGSYNILSPRYDESFESYFDMLDSLPNPKDRHATFSLSEERFQKLDMLLRENGLKISGKELFQFFTCVIEGRESVKFEFSKLLSYALKLIKELGENLDIEVQDMAHLDIKSILSLYSSLYKDSPKERFLSEIQAHKLEFALTLSLKLPSLILRGSDVWSFYLPHIAPNFITQKSVIADVLALETLAQDSIKTQDFRDKIVLIESADPGFDFLFAQPIAGFITCYGGANSHMAIRAAELQMPAVIGVGEEAFAKYKLAHKLRLECASEQILCL